MSRPVSNYYDRKWVEAAVGTGQHRDVIGGLWDTLGPIQLELMIKYGLEPSHKFLDIGCGSLRGGVHFVRFLDPGHYFGVDLNESLLDAGYNVELAAQDLQNKLPRMNLVTDGEFQFGRFGVQFDRAIAFSLFTHLPLNQIRICLEKLSQVISPGGMFFATFFEAPEHVPSHRDILQGPGGVTTHGASDPYHQRVSDFHYLVASLPWEVEFISDFGHPRDQKLVGFRRKPDSRPADEAMAELPLK
ncbi:class I SAM-dependent methyltransferase, partial [Hoeflea sp.]|uniref:class I SAM-dependent methyltransferase n=1 Tax=Hoeflea sp. TaxID=1940281 RepID=UPI0019C90F5C